MTPRPPGTYDIYPDPVLTQVRVVEEDGYNVLRFECKDETIKFGITNESLCLEEFGIRVREAEKEDGFTEAKDYDFTSFLGLEIQDIEYVNIKHDWEKEIHSAAVEMSFKGKRSLIIEIYNYHNGYYIHGYLIQYGTWCDKDDL